MKNTNKKGMTLVEVIISMCILAAIAGMFVTVAVAAKKKNTDTYLRSNEMYEQAAAAEAFDTSKDYGAGSSHIKKLLTGGASSTNEYKLTADFGTLKLEPKTYGYVAERRNKDKNDTNYQLRFFRSENAEIATPNPAEGEYWVKVYNHSGTELRLQFDAQSGKFYTNSRASLGETVGVVLANENETALGYCVGEESDLFTISDWENPGLIIASFDEGNITDYMEVKDGHVTGFIIIHICDGLEVKNQEAFDAG